MGDHPFIYLKKKKKARKLDSSSKDPKSKKLTF